MTTISIKHHSTCDVLYTCDVDDDDASPLRTAVERAVASGTDLDGADLNDADLRCANLRCANLASTAARIRCERAIRSRSHSASSSASSPAGIEAQ